MAPCKIRTNKHKKSRIVFEVKDLSDILSPPPTGTTINFDLVKVGNAAKICVAMERFWCKITEVKGEVITARVANQLVNVPWPMGMKLKFHRNCVYAVDDEEDTWEPYERIQNMRLVPENVPA